MRNRARPLAYYMQKVAGLLYSSPMDVVGFKPGPPFSGGGADEVEHPSQAPPLLLRHSSLRRDYRNGAWEFFFPHAALQYWYGFTFYVLTVVTSLWFPGDIIPSVAAMEGKNKS